MSIENECLLYLRLIMYPLAAFALTIIATIRWQEGVGRSWVVLMALGVGVIMSFFTVELLMLLNPEIHETIKEYFLTPFLTALAIWSWQYVFRITKNENGRITNGN